MSAPYAAQIRKVVGSLYDPRHVESYMRLAHSTLDGLSPSQFRREVLIAVDCIREAGLAAAESLAESFGMVRS